MTAITEFPRSTSVIDQRGSEPSFLLSRRAVRYTLGLFWILDGALQLQPYMFTRGFAHDIIAPAAVGQPPFVAVPVRLNAELIAHQPVLWTAVFAVVQLAIGAGFLFPRTWRAAIVVSVFWAGGVWYAGEGLGGLAGGHANALVGAPGAALLYAVLAMAAWPETRTVAHGGRERPPHWLPKVWAVLWIGAAVLDLLPGNRPASTFGVQLATNASSSPAWLSHFDEVLGHGVHRLGVWTTLGVVAVELAIGCAALCRRPLRSLSLAAGVAIAAAYWAAGQSFGQLFSGHATDPSTGPLLILIGVASFGVSSLAVTRTPRMATDRGPSPTGRPTESPVSA